MNPVLLPSPYIPLSFHFLFGFSFAARVTSGLIPTFWANLSPLSIIALTASYDIFQSHTLPPFMGYKKYLNMQHLIFIENMEHNIILFSIEKHY